MKLDKLKFARLICHIQHWIERGTMLNEADIDDIDFTVDFEVPTPAPNIVSCISVDDLLKAVALGEKISAIKAYRTLTGAGLKESKDAVEKYWNYEKPAVFTAKQLSNKMLDSLNSSDQEGQSTSMVPSTYRQMVRDFIHSFGY